MFKTHHHITPLYVWAENITITFIHFYEWVPIILDANVQSSLTLHTFAVSFTVLPNNQILRYITKFADTYGQNKAEFSEFISKQLSNITNN